MNIPLFRRRHDGIAITINGQTVELDVADLQELLNLSFRWHGVRAHRAPLQRYPAHHPTTTVIGRP